MEKGSSRLEAAIVCAGGTYLVQGSKNAFGTETGEKHTFF